MAAKCIVEDSHGAPQCGVDTHTFDEWWEVEEFVDNTPGLYDRLLEGYAHIRITDLDACIEESYTTTNIDEADKLATAHGYTVLILTLTKYIDIEIDDYSTGEWTSAYLCSDGTYNAADVRGCTVCNDGKKRIGCLPANDTHKKICRLIARALQRDMPKAHACLAPLNYRLGVRHE